MRDHYHRTRARRSRTSARPFKGETVVLMTPQMAGIRRTDMGELVGDLAAKRPEILAALDLLFTGV
jgi:hypothetical protein